MSSTRTASYRQAQDHFQPQGDDDPHAQRRLRGLLEQIDYTAFASNKEVLSQRLRAMDAGSFQRMAVAAAQARAQWVCEAAAMADTGHSPTAADGARLAGLRQAYEEMAEAYEALRRMVERGYLHYRG